MTEQKIKTRIQQIVKRANSRGLKIYKNNIDRAKPIRSICGAIKAKRPYSTVELLCR